ncbi:MAG: TerB family tellurite resistance protein [Polyangiaceae bacterium]|nr:TerB family tellurite resistance protein [Polyangiaceae bacterium]
MTNPEFLRDFDDPKLEALTEVMFLAASADGDFSAEERAHFQTSLESLTNGRFGADRFEAFFAKVSQALSSEGRSARLASVKERLPDAGARKVALSLAVQLTAADGIIRTSERELILETAEALEIDSDTAASIVADIERR